MQGGFKDRIRVINVTYEEKCVHIEAYSPLGDETVINVAKKYDTNTAKILISWNVQRGNIVLSKCATECRLKSSIRTITLEKEDFDALNQLSVKEGVRRIV